MIRPSRKILVALVAALASASSQAVDLSVGPAVFFATHQVDHTKIGPCIGVDFNLFGARFESVLQAGAMATEVVNEGAKKNSSAPSLKESHSGNVPAYLRLMLRLNSTLLGAIPSVGVQSYFTAMGRSSSAVPIAVSGRLAWPLLSGPLSAEGALAAGVQATSFAPLTFLAKPEISGLWAFSNSFGLGLQLGAITAYALSSPSVTVTQLQTALSVHFF